MKKTLCIFLSLVMVTTGMMSVCATEEVKTEEANKSVVTCETTENTNEVKEEVPVVEKVKEEVPVVEKVKEEVLVVEKVKEEVPVVERNKASFVDGVVSKISDASQKTVSSVKSSVNNHRNWWVAGTVAVVTAVVISIAAPIVKKYRAKKAAKAINAEKISNEAIEIAE